MFRRTALVAVPFVVLALASGVLSGQTTLKSTIEGINKKFLDALVKGDAAGIAALYSDDAEVLPPGSDVVAGRQAIENLWKSVIDSGVAGAEFTTRRVDEAGSYAIETGAYVMKRKDGTVDDRGKYLAVWKKTGTGWQIYRDIWTTNTTAPGK